MAFTVTLYQFQKRKNSTLQPTALQGVELSCELKQPTSYKNPVFTFFVEAGFEWNYLKWDSWYYFITDVVSVRNNIFEVHCKLDVLATYKTEIGATTAFVLYDTAANTEVTDSRLSMKTTTTYSVSRAILDYSLSACLVLGIVGDDSSGMYAMSSYSANQLVNAASLDDFWDDIKADLPSPSQRDGGFHFHGLDDAINDIFAFIVRAFQQLVATGRARDCIRSAVWLPVSESDFDGTNETIWLGQLETNVSAKKVMLPALKTVTVSIPWQASDWRRKAPYHNVYLTLPAVGVVPLATNDLIDCTSLVVNCFLSTSGAVKYIVNRGGDEKPLGMFYGQVGGSYMIGSSNITPLTAASSLAGGISAAAAGAALGGLAGAAAAGAAGIAGLVSANTPMPASVGAGSGFTSGGWTVECMTAYHDTNVDPSSVAAAIGTPTMAVKTIGTLSGFIQTREASVNASCYEDVRTEINSLMDGGFFYE